MASAHALKKENWLPGFQKVVTYSEIEHHALKQGHPQHTTLSCSNTISYKAHHNNPQGHGPTNAKPMHSKRKLVVLFSLPPSAKPTMIRMSVMSLDDSLYAYFSLLLPNNDTRVLFSYLNPKPLFPHRRQCPSLENFAPNSPAFKTN
ncbi:hypothetical protein VNO80_10426 [Phaseolus coccineus]|uniref:Uncharacterized protein n=1 Tax=Phaseolus coccineus TaxID=3886 RepID=A0AAN9N8M7_PHACN